MSFFTSPEVIPFITCLIVAAVCVIVIRSEAKKQHILE